MVQEENDQGSQVRGETSRRSPAATSRATNIGTSRLSL